MQKENEITLLELIKHVYKYRVMVFVITLVFASISVLYALNLPNRYKSESLVIPVSYDSSTNVSGLMSQFGGLAGLAGINLGTSGQSNVDRIIETVRSRVFLSEFINKHNLLVSVLAANGWNKEDEKLSIDPDIYDIIEKKWVRSAAPPRKIVPTLAEGVEAFKEILTIDLDKENGFLTISIESFSPQIAKMWVELLIVEANEWIKREKEEEVNRSIKFLNKQVENMQEVEMKSAFYKLIEEQIKNKMLLEVRDEYALEVIDPPSLPELKSSPKRALICIAFTFVGFFLSVLVALIRN